MAIGRTFPESLQKALRSMETGLTGLDDIAFEGLGQGDDKNVIRAALGTPSPDRLLKVAQALRLGVDHEQIYDSCKIDPWFIEQLQDIVDCENRVRAHGLPAGRRPISARSRRWASPTSGSPSSRASRRARSPRAAARSTCIPSISASTPARRSSPRPPPICTRPTSPASPGRRSAKRGRATRKKSSFSAAGPTASARASSSTIAAAMPPSRCRRRATRPS